ncbi:translation initiation factor IF-2 [Oceanirhabdus sp. W0125-5]|uniref:translation initiation factor IF-2 n=1 Tax=Oceanirhabdus sp. W0125-5 TaxID=2999116 RepID=UPI0022F2AAE1|nr:translation initiation factor IF-2 [Oceanirhabdus sp. W0125-5]WBW94834.1 translation initiation factor IF-2 [Oceanirhabdus sp. W0125-5]
MTKIRVYELAKELNVPSKELINILLEEFGVKVKNHMSVIEEEDAELIKELFGSIEEESEVVEMYENIENENVLKNIKKVKNKKTTKKAGQKEEEQEDELLEFIEIEETISVSELSEKLKKPVTEVIRELIFVGVMAGINQEIDFETAEKLCAKFEVQAIKKEEEEGAVEEDTDIEEDVNGVKRPPIITVMGHVDHGKTSLLDAIKQTDVTSTEAGGITQHIGAYTVKVNNETLTFLDTPGHEAFTAMRARGAKITDLVILVVAADDGIMPQTIEAINHCKAAEVPMIVAINKMDKVGANPDRVKQELTEHGLVAEDWGGDVICVPVSAHTKEGLDQLLEMVVLSSEMMELQADPDRNGKGTVVEARLDKGRGAVATLLVQNGTLRVGDSIYVGTTYGRIRAMFNDKGEKIQEAGPSMPAEILGLSDVPSSGERFVVAKDEKTARARAEKKAEALRQEKFKKSHKVSLEDLYSQIQEGKVKELDIIVKADVQGSVEAIIQSLEKLSTDTVKVRVIHGAVGAISETDVTLASASNALVIGFNVRPTVNASSMAEKEEVEIKTYRIIYDALDDIKSAMVGLLDPEYKEVVLGTLEVRETYKVSNVGTIAGCYVQTGKITRHSKVRIIRQGIVILDTELGSLKRFKDDVKEVNTGYECGVTIERFNDIKIGDLIEAYIIEEIKVKSL